MKAEDHVGRAEVGSAGRRDGPNERACPVPSSPLVASSAVGENSGREKGQGVAACKVQGMLRLTFRGTRASCCARGDRFDCLSGGMLPLRPAQGVERVERKGRPCVVRDSRRGSRFEANREVTCQRRRSEPTDEGCRSGRRRFVQAAGLAASAVALGRSVAAAESAESRKGAGCGRRRIAQKAVRQDGRHVVGSGDGRAPSGRLQDGRRGDSAGPRGGRRRHHVLRQLLGILERPGRGLAGPRAQRAARQGFSDDQGLHPRPRGRPGDADARRVAAAAADRPSRFVANPRRGVRQRSRAGLRKGGVLEALDKAKQQGKTRFVGFTGHKSPDVHLDMIRRGYPFDAVQMPLNVLDANFRSFEQKVLPELNKRGIAALGMKPMSGKATRDQERAADGGGDAALRDEPAGGDDDQRHGLARRAASKPAPWPATSRR